jgi:YkoY family integral membrane protein
MIENIIHQILGEDPRASMLIIFNLILIESLLSIDNAAVLATLVMDLPKEQRARALRIGIIFAYIFRGLCLLFASLLIQITWLKLIGALYLLYLCISHFRHKHLTRNEINKDHSINKKKNRFYQFLKPIFGTFWSTVILVEIMDLVFSLDNVFAAVVYAKDNIYLIWIGVFIGIITMRLVAVFFVKLMERFPLLNDAAYLVIGCLGLKLLLDFCCKSTEHPFFCNLAENEKADFFFSVLTLIIFLIPILFGYLKERGRAKKAE